MSYEIQTIKLTRAAAAEAIAKIITDADGPATVDLVNEILNALGFK